MHTLGFSNVRLARGSRPIKTKKGGRRSEKKSVRKCFLISAENKILAEVINYKIVKQLFLS
jgi:hypothetical protein